MKNKTKTETKTPRGMTFAARRNVLDFDPMMDTADAAIYLKMHPQTIRDKAHARAIPIAGLAGGEYRFRKSSLDTWMEKQKAEANHANRKRNVTRGTSDRDRMGAPLR